MLWTKFRDQLRRTLDDKDAATWSSDDLLDYVNAAMRRFAVHTALEKTWTYSADTAQESVVLPDDILALGPVWFPKRELLMPLKLSPGEVFLSTSVTTTTLPVGYYRWPTKTLNFGQSLPAGKTLTLYYWAYYEELVQDTDEVVVPKWSLEALEWYVVYRAMTRPGISQAMLGQYDTKQDSGQPEHNPLEKYSTYAFKQFEKLLYEYPAQDRSGWDSVLT